MALWHIHTNEGEFLVDRKSEDQIRTRMYEYIREKKKAGISLAAVVYCYRPAQVRYKLP